MPLCRVRYHCTLTHADPANRDWREPAIGVFDEERLFDEWGDPGAVVSRCLVMFEGARAGDQYDRVTGANAGIWRYQVDDLIGSVEWRP